MTGFPLSVYKQTRNNNGAPGAYYATGSKHLIPYPFDVFELKWWAILDLNQ